jgi:hypothetical protein
MISFADPDGNSGSLLGRLVGIGDYLFLDLYPPEREDSGYAYMLTLDTHAFALVVQTEPDLIVRDMDDEWLRHYVEDNPGALSYDDIEGVYIDCSTRVTTASTEELQVFMIEHVDTEGAYSDPTVFHRVEEAAGTAEEESPSEGS